MRFHKPQPRFQVQKCRSWRVFDRGAFADALESSILCAPDYYMSTYTMDSLTKENDTVLSDLLDKQ